MNILLVTATDIEMNSLPLENEAKFTNLEFTRLVTGPGIMNTAYALGKCFSQSHYHLAINMGLAGSFRAGLPLTSVVNVTSEILSDFGAEDDKKFLTAFDLGLIEKNEFPYKNCMLLNNSILPDLTLDLPTVQGITVNNVHGNATSIQGVVERFHPDVESMEGAAFFYACLLEKVPFIEIRTVSNFVEKRNRAAWKIHEALASLRMAMDDILMKINDMAGSKSQHQ